MLLRVLGPLLLVLFEFRILPTALTGGARTRRHCHRNRYSTLLLVLATLRLVLMALLPVLWTATARTTAATNRTRRATTRIRTASTVFGGQLY